MPLSSASFLRVVLTRSFSIAKEKTGGWEHAVQSLRQVGEESTAVSCSLSLSAQRPSRQPQWREGTKWKISLEPGKEQSRSWPICPIGCIQTPKAREQLGVGTVLVRVSTAMTKHHEQSKPKRKGFIWLTLPHHSLSLKEVKTRTQTRQEPGGKN